MKKLLLFLIVHSAIFSISIRVRLKNASTNGIGQVDELRLIQLKQGMKVLKAVKSIRGNYAFRNLKPATQYPYMVQANYKGINYSQVITPMRTVEPVTLKVYENTKSYNTQLMRQLALYRIRHGEGALQVHAFYSFSNQSKKTFAEKEGGLYFHIPGNATQVDASTSVGTGKSNISSLGVVPFDSKEKEGAKVLAQALKPGEKNYQIKYTIPYKNKQAKIQILNYYPLLGDKLRILIDKSSSMQFKIDELPEWSMKFKTDAIIKEKKYFEVPMTKQPLTLSMSGGEAIIREAHSFLKHKHKMALAITFIISLAATLIYFNTKPDWLSRIGQNQKQKEEKRLQKITKDVTINEIKEGNVKLPLSFTSLRRYLTSAAIIVIGLTLTLAHLSSEIEELSNGLIALAFGLGYGIYSFVLALQEKNELREAIIANLSKEQ